LYQSLKMIENKDPPRENPSPKRKASPSNMPRHWRMRGLQLVDSWSSRPRKPFAGLPKCPRGAGQKEVSCAGLRRPARAARADLGGVITASLATLTPPSAARPVLYGSLRMAADSWGVMGILWGLLACVHVSCGPRSPGRRPLPRAAHLFLPGRATLPCQGRRRQPWHRRERGWKCAVVCPRGQGCLARASTMLVCTSC